MQIGLRYPSWLNTTNSVCIMNLLFPFVFFAFSGIQTNAEHGLRQPCSANLLPLRLDLLSSPSCPSSIGHNPWGRTTHTYAHTETRLSWACCCRLFALLSAYPGYTHTPYPCLGICWRWWRQTSLAFGAIRYPPGFGHKYHGNSCFTWVFVDNNGSIYIVPFSSIIYIYIHISSCTMVPNLLALQTRVRSTHCTVVGSQTFKCTGSPSQAQIVVGFLV